MLDIHNKHKAPGCVLYLYFTLVCIFDRCIFPEITRTHKRCVGYRLQAVVDLFIYFLLFVAVFNSRAFTNQGTYIRDVD